MCHSNSDLWTRTNARADAMVVSLVGDGYRRAGYVAQDGVLIYTLRNIRSRRSLKLLVYPRIGLIQLIEKRKVLKSVQL